MRILLHLNQEKDVTSTYIVIGKAHNVPFTPSVLNYKSF
jgi:hypothetical protein